MPSYEPAEQSEVAASRTSRMGAAVLALQNALASASRPRECPWHQTVHAALEVLQSALQETREAAESEGSLLSQVVAEAPRLAPRAARLREEYVALDELIGALRGQLARAHSDRGGLEVSSHVEVVRQQLHQMLKTLHHIEATETELLYEAFEVDIGNGD